jgi:phytoene synthase
MPQLFIAPEDMAACRALLCTGSRSFFAAGRLLPRRVRRPATALYAFCRIADDAIDLGADKPAALAGLQARLDAIYAGAPAADPVDRAFAATITAYRIPRALPEALLEGMAWDSAGRRYASLAALQDYAARVAGSVGVMMALLMGARDAQACARAADLGVAMQLTNIARDVGEDARAGRVFLPLDWLAEAGIDVEDFLRRPEFDAALGGLVARLLAEAEILYARAGAGIALLPLDCRVGIAAARRIYAGIGGRIAASGHDSITRRARVPGRGKLLAAARAGLDAVALRSAQAPVLPANAFLVAAAEAAAPPDPVGFAWILELFARLDQAQREGAGAAV